MNPTRDPRFDILFQPLQIGPVTAPNRFYQVPHCTGMGYARPNVLNAMRAIKAEGGWGVVNTEYCSVHPSSDDDGYPYASLWDDTDTRNLAGMADAVHAHGALAGVELWHGGQNTSNLGSRETALGPESLPTLYAPWQCKKMDKADIAEMRLWHRNAALRAKAAGFDIVYVYAGHSYLLAQYLNAAVNRRSDGYGGELANRARLLCEVLADTRDAIGDRCAIATRIEVGAKGAIRDAQSMLMATIAPEIDLFDVTVPDYYGHEMASSRFRPEGALEDDIAHVRALTGKPVVSVGRFTSPETMLSQVRRGVVDLIGAARPSIADPFLPAKIRDGRLDDIRECIGCNICYAHNSLQVPIRCTQNPTMGEEWRRGWHPEQAPALVGQHKAALVVGGGPAGLETALTLGRRGMMVMLAEAEDQFGGRVTLEATLPGLGEWARVRDWRLHQLSKLPEVELFPASRMTAQDCLDTGAAHVFVATGSLWRINGRGVAFPGGVESYANPMTLPVDAVLKGARPTGDVIVFDDEGYYLAASVAEALALGGARVRYVTSRNAVAAWTQYTGEQAQIHKRLADLGVTLHLNALVAELGNGVAQIDCAYTARRETQACDHFIPVTSREPQMTLWDALQGKGLESLQLIGDCKAPGIIAQAVHDGHRAGRAFGGPETPARRDRVALAG